MIRALEETHYNRVSWYSTIAFMRMKLGGTLPWTISPHVFESQEEARAFLERVDDAEQRLNRVEERVFQWLPPGKHVWEPV